MGWVSNFYPSCPVHHHSYWPALFCPALLFAVYCFWREAVTQEQPTFCSFWLLLGIWTRNACHVRDDRTRLQKQDGPILAAYVSFLHEIVTHNMFSGGFYVLMVVIMMVERDSYAYKVQKKTDKSEGKSDDATADSPGPVNVLTFLLRWVWPAVVGISVAIFATTTYSWITAAAFFMFTLFYVVQGCGIPACLTIGDNMIVSSTMAKASCVGLVVIAVQLLRKQIPA